MALSFSLYPGKKQTYTKKKQTYQILEAIKRESSPVEIAMTNLMKAFDKYEIYQSVTEEFKASVRKEFLDLEQLRYVNADILALGIFTLKEYPYSTRNNKFTPKVFEDYRIVETLERIQKDYKDGRETDKGLIKHKEVLFCYIRMIINFRGQI